MMTPAVGMSALPSLITMCPLQSVQIQGQAGPASEDHAILQACQLELDALSHASSLCEVIEQVEEGHIQRIQNKYGPCKGHPPHPLWENIKVTMNRQEWLYIQLEKEFAGKKDCFFDFFTHQPRNELALSSKGKCKVSASLGESLFPLCKVVGAIPR